MSKDNASITSLEKGRAVIAAQVKDLPDTPGVYRMLGDDGRVLYVGKAKALAKRVASYTRPEGLSNRLLRMVAQTRAMEFVHTETEIDALLLECNLIKELKPHFNILLRDDKSFPYILITGDHDFPLITKHRGSKKRAGQYFGPFASAGDVNRTIGVLQRVFKLRNCSDHYFATRKRPCLQYHIKRCTAPCVGKVSCADYAEQVKEARDFLSGKSRAVQERLLALMQEASDAQNYEVAAELRDRVRALTSIQARQDIYVEGLEEADVVAVHAEGGRSCVQVFFFRAGQNFGNRSYFPRHAPEDTAEEILGSFLAQFYAHREAPREVLISHKIEDKAFLAEALSEAAGRQVKMTLPQRGAKRRVIDFALKNAASALAQHTAQQMREAKFLADVADLFNMDEPPARIEVYDNSHISGTHMVGAMIVAGAEGFRRNAYRKFNIKQAAASDDYGMMREVLGRRFKNGVADADSGDWPDLLLIDGGAGQLSAAKEALQDCGVWDRVTVVAIAKGEDRNAGRERFFMEGRAEFQLPLNNPTLHYLQRLRDEAHRFAISTHRARRTKAIQASPLDGISGIGAARKKALLHHFGSAKAVGAARLEELAAVEGISRAMAQKIYDYFHER